MRVAVLMIVAVVALSSQCTDAFLLDQIKDMGNKIKENAKALGGKLVPVKDALIHQAKEKAKSFASQSLQALAGAFVNAFKGFSFKNMFGKRSLNSHVQESVGAHMDALYAKTKEDLEAIFEKTLSRVAPFVKNLMTSQDMKNLKSISDEHDLAVRGILGDTLNKAIEGLKKIYYKAKSFLTGPKKAPEPVMIG